MGISRENQNRSLLTAKDQLRKAKHNFLRLRKTGDEAIHFMAKKRKRSVRRDILSFDDEFVDELKYLRRHA